MNQLEQLKQRTIIVADSGDIDSIIAYHPEDATTNPSLVYKAAQLPQYQNLIKEIVATLVASCFHSSSSGNAPARMPGSTRYFTCERPLRKGLSEVKGIA